MRPLKIKISAFGPYAGVTEIDMEKRRWIDKGTVAHILGLAAHSEMYRLLDKYKK